MDKPFNQGEAVQRLVLAERGGPRSKLGTFSPHGRRHITYEEYAMPCMVSIATQLHARSQDPNP